LETRGGQILQFVNQETGKRAAIQEFAIGIPAERATHQSSNGIWYQSEKALPNVSVAEVTKGFIADENLVIRTQQLTEDGKKTVLSREASLAKINEAVGVVEGANLVHNEYGNRLFADFFFFITGFHGFHVFSGVVINIIIFFNVILGTYERRGHYEMVEKVGLYWHFVDLVWVFVFTFFYLV
jgi:cytochrome c oxidase subunit 3